MKLQDSEKPLVEGKKEPVTKHTEFHELCGVCETHRHDHSVLGHRRWLLLDMQEGEVDKATATLRGKPAGPGPVPRSHRLQAKATQGCPGPCPPRATSPKLRDKNRSTTELRQLTPQSQTELPEPKLPEARDEPVSRHPGDVLLVPCLSRSLPLRVRTAGGPSGDTGQPPQTVPMVQTAPNFKALSPLLASSSRDHCPPWEGTMGKSLLESN